jgi:hypothetical protein
VLAIIVNARTHVIDSRKGNICVRVAHTLRNRYVFPISLRSHLAVETEKSALTMLWTNFQIEATFRE